jgi:ribosomal protein S18 acetylase RimI-like enzyme
MTQRRLVLPGDLDIVYNLLVDSFQYPEHPEWDLEEDELEGFKATIATLKRIWPLYRLIKWTSPALRDALLGYIWEEDGQPVGLVSVSRRGSTDSWMVGNVSVLPEYRRRGIARRLVQAGLDFIREQGGKLAVLDVISGNLPAYELYKSLGFEHYTSMMEMEQRSGGVPALPPIPEGYLYEKVPMKDWQTPLELARRLVPDKVQAFDPPTKGRYYTPPALRLFATIMNKMRGTIAEDFALREAKTSQVVALGSINAQTRPGDRHHITMSVGQEQAALVPFLLQLMLHKVKSASPEHAVDTALWEWRYFTIEEHQKAGFTKGKEGHRLGINL